MRRDTESNSFDLNIMEAATFKNEPAYAAQVRERARQMAVETGRPALICYAETGETYETVNAAHGDERNRRLETEQGKDVQMVDTRSGRTVYAGASSSHTRTIVEKFCAGCNKWIEVRGVFGMIALWIAEHEGHLAAPR